MGSMSFCRDTFRIEDLSRCHILAHDESGKRVIVDLKDATNEQFGAWAKTRMVIDEKEASYPWSLEERASFCDCLWERGELYLDHTTVNYQD